MTTTERLLYRRRRGLWIIAALLFLGGALAVAFLQINQAQERADQLAAEASLRGSAVSTLATDVRTLRSQIQARGGTPAAPDPARAVANLPDRAQVPVPIPGPAGPKGAKGDPAPTITPSPGPSGARGAAGIGQVGPSGAPGTDGQSVTGPAGPPGPAGADGKDGADGTDGHDGAAGHDAQTCPDGYSLQAPAYDPDALVCRRDGGPSPSPSSPASQGVLGLGVLAATSTYRRV